MSVAVAEQRIVGRITGGHVADLTAAQTRTLINVEDGANAYVHPATDGNKHVPANSTTNNGKVLTASGTAGTYTWETPTGGSGDVATDTIWDSSGDLVIGTGANTAAKLTKGATGRVLTAGASTISWEEPTGLSAITAESVLANNTGSSAVPAAVALAEQTLLGRITGGHVVGLTVAQVKTLLDLTNFSIATIDMSSATWAVPWGHSIVTSTVTWTTSTTLSDITGLVQTGLIAAKRYLVEATLFVTATVNGGIKITLHTPDTLSATAMRIIGDSYDTTGAIVKHSNVTALDASICAATAAVEVIKMTGYIEVNVAGTLRLRAAQNASHGDTTSILAGSWMRVTQVAP